MINDIYGYIGSDNGLIEIELQYNSNDYSNVNILFRNNQVLSEEYITTLSFSETLNILAIGTYNRVWRFNLTSINDTNINNTNEYQYTYTQLNIDDYPNKMIFIDYDKYIDLYIVNNVCINILRYTDNFELFIRIGKDNGLPYRNITNIVPGFDDSIFVSHLNGAISRYFPDTNEDNIVSVNGNWEYYQGNRYIPNGNITTIYCNIDNNILYVATETGLGIIYGNETTLETKANIFENIMYPRHNRYGQVGDITLNQTGNVSGYIKTPNDNNGLWTAIYLSGLILKYNITKDNETLNRIFIHANALEMFHKINGVNYGYVCRSFCKIGDYCCNSECGGTWYNSTTINGYVWKGDTSSDEICGHMMVYAILYDIIGINNYTLSVLYLNMMTSIIDYIVDNNYKLIGMNGPTTWGYWDPYRTNYNCDDDCDGRGLQSLQILSWLLQCYHYTNLHVSIFKNDTNKYNSSKYLEAWLDLGVNNGYFINVVNQKITIPDDINHSDDELAALAYVAYYWTINQYNYYIKNNMEYRKLIEKDWEMYVKPYYNYFDLSWNRTWNCIHTKYQSLYSLLNVWINHEYNNNELIEDINEDLKTWPMGMHDILYSFFGCVICYLIYRLDILGNKEFR